MSRADILAGIVSGIVVVVAALAVAVSRLTTRIARLEEWVRIWERKNGQ